MRLTEHKRNWVKNRVIKYCKSMEVDVPNFLLLTKQEWQEWASFRKSQEGLDRYRNASNYLGICSRKYKVIAIFVKSFTTLKRLDQTIRHELVHYVRRYNHRTENFERCMKQLLKGNLTA